eukprot:GHUV01041441.1.p1 GENE.GHUV01041441.1~~GHUV01041441.1.p1  ORF type:complete len:139 (-),score=38.46 GHUV01041441.1:30-446(-)
MSSLGPHGFPSQVSNAQVGKLARLAAGRPADTTSSSNGNGNGITGPELVMDDFRHTADQAYGSVDVPDSVIDILAELRCYLQDKCEPPIYVSDRRFMKAVQLLQVRRVVSGSTSMPGLGWAAIQVRTALVAATADSLL